MRDLILFGRQGCCLCEGLEQRLRALDLQHLNLRLVVLDIDSPDFSPELRARYDLQVPVLGLENAVLPRVSPRLSGDGLRNWLHQACSKPRGSA